MSENRESEPAATAPEATPEAREPAADMAAVEDVKAEAPPQPQPPPPTPDREEPPRRSAALAIFVWLVFLLLLAAVAGGGWYLWQFQQQLQALSDERDLGLNRIELALEEEAEQRRSLASRQQELAQTARRAAADVATVDERIDATEELLTRLADSVQGGRWELQLAGIEQLLLLANDRVLLAADVHGAERALAAADRRLAQLNDPRLFRVREAISDERAALRGIEQPDLASAVLSLGSLQRRADSLPINARTPTRYTPAEVAKPTAADAPWYHRIWNSVSSALAGLYTVRREEGEVRKLLPPETQALTVALLKLKLEAARVALLNRDDASYRELCNSALTWLDEQFKRQDPAVQAVAAELERLRAVELQPQLPEISRSLTLLRAQFQQGE